MGMAKPMPWPLDRDQGVDAHHVAVDVDERAAAIALVDGGIGLQIIPRGILPQAVPPHRAR